MHCHNTMQIVFDTHSSFRFRLRNGDWKNYNSLIIKENATHQLNPNNSVQLIIYLDPNSEIAASIKNRYLDEKDICSPDLNIFQITNVVELQQSIINPQPAILEKFIFKVLTYLSGEYQFSTIDERVKLIERTITLSHPDDLTQKYLAEKVYLSESRLRSLFKQTTGTSLHQYYLSNKIRFATNQIMIGNSIKDAAIKAGFTDTSHLQKMMLKQYGIGPSKFIKEKLMSTDIILDSAPLYLETTVC